MTIKAAKGKTITTTSASFIIIEEKRSLIFSAETTNGYRKKIIDIFFLLANINKMFSIWVFKIFFHKRNLF
jgi:hypothetical protein